MREVEADVLCIADACACSVTIVPLKIKHSSARLGVFAAGKFQKGETTGSYYETLVYPNLWSRRHTRKVHGNGDLKVDVVRIF